MRGCITRGETKSKELKSYLKKKTALMSLKMGHPCTGILCHPRENRILPCPIDAAYIMDSIFHVTGPKAF